MKKRFGFTLAEVLITMGIIGVVAAISVPILTSDAKEKQYMTQFKKTFSMLTTAGVTSEAEDDFGYADLTSDDISNTYDEKGDVTRSLYGLLSSKTNVIDAGTVANMKMNTNVNSTYETHAIAFADGTALIYSPAQSLESALNDGFGENCDFYATIDVNGPKGPNTYTNCNNNDNATTFQNSLSNDGPYATGKCNDNNLIIKDRFGIIVKYDGKIYPADISGAYILRNK